MTAPYFQELGNRITCVDTGLYRQRLAACYLVEAGGHAAFIDTGTAHSVPRLLELLHRRGLETDDVAYVIPTHVHLDHAGGAGELMRQCPQAQLVIHPKGAPHMLDPSKLIAGATAVYGEPAFAKHFGTLTPVPEQRVQVAEDGHQLDLGGRRLTIVDTPGHANHHFCLFDEESSNLFTGDTFGISYREFDGETGPFIFAPTTPVAFDPTAWPVSIDKLLTFRPEGLCLTHYGRLPFTSELAQQLRASILQMAAIATEEQSPREGRKQRIAARVMDELLAQLRARNCDLPQTRCRRLLAGDVELNAQGLEVWLVRQERRAEQTATARS